MIFLGQASNYSAGQVLRQLFAWGTPSDSAQLKQALAERYGAQPENVALYHTGRSALTVAFQQLLPQGGPVILPGLTCIAVVRAIKAAGCQPLYVDIDPETLQYDFAALAKACQNLPQTSSRPQNHAKPIDKNEKECYNGIIVAQNTLGLPLDMAKLQSLAERYHLAIVEDLAHSAGRFYPDGREIGSVGQATALSFGKGKAIDTIEGGALVLKAPSSASPLTQPRQKPRLSRRLRDRWYPLFGAIARGLAHLKLERYWLGLLLKLHWIERSADAELAPDVRLTHWQARLARRQLAHLPSTPLREHALVARRSELLAELRQHGYCLDEIWYDTPVSPARYAKEADFPTKACPETAKIAKQIVNLPTWYPEAKLARARETIQKYEVKHD